MSPLSFSYGQTENKLTQTCFSFSYYGKNETGLLAGPSKTLRSWMKFRSCFRNCQLILEQYTPNSVNISRINIRFDCKSP